MSSSVSSWAPKALLAGSLLASLLPAQAAVVNLSNGAYAATFVRDCRSPGNTSGTPDMCEAAPGFTVNPDGSTSGFGWTPAQTEAQLTLNGFVASATTGSAFGIVGGEATRSLIDASGAAGVLNLKQGVFTQPTARASGHSLGLQSFYYDGPTETRTVQSIFDYTSNVAPSDLNLPGAGGSYTDPVVYAKGRVMVFSLTTSSFAFDFDPNAWNVQGDAFADGLALVRADFRLEGVLDSVLTVDEQVMSLGFQVEAGRYYFVQSYLGLWGRFGGILDATHTFTSTLGEVVNNAFTPTTEGFTAAPPARQPVVFDNGVQRVPEPGTLAAGALGLALLGWARRRRQG